MTFVLFACRLHQGVSLLSAKLALVTGKGVKYSQSMKSQIVTITSSVLSLEIAEAHTSSN